MKRFGWLAPLRRARPLPASRTLALSLGLILGGLVLVPGAYRGVPPGLGEGTWLAGLPALIAMFALAEYFVFHIEIDSEAYTFSLSEVPLALGLMFAEPWHLLIARLVGEALILIVWERQTPTKLAFNFSVFFAETTTALWIFHALGVSAAPVHWQSWLAVLAAVGLAGLLATVSVLLVIHLHGGKVDATLLVRTTVMTSAVNTCLAAVSAVLLSASAAALIPFVVIMAITVSAYRGYTQLRRRYAGLELLYQFTRITGGAQSPDETMQQVLDEASRLLRTQGALIALYAPNEEQPWLLLSNDRSGVRELQLPELIRRRVLQGGELVRITRTEEGSADRGVLEELNAKDLLAAPLISGGETTGVLAVFDRLGSVSTFDEEDGRLFATLASQAAVALENGRLIDRLQTQIQAREHEALHDALTGLPNRSLFYDRLQRAIADLADTQAGVLVLDLDGFKDINDTLGHHTGDGLLCQVADRLLATIGDAGTVARLGGDEFAVLLPHLDDVAAGLEIAARVNAEIRRPVRLASMTLSVGVSVGMSAAPEHGRDPVALLQRADVAMYQAKRDQTGVALYDPTADWNSEHRLRVAAELRDAVAAGTITLAYQPIARAVDGFVVGVEALARWTHPQLGRIRPDEFIPVAERTGLIHDLTLSVLDQALAQTRRWLDDGYELKVAVNLPPQVLRDVEWPAKVVEALHRRRVPARLLTLEITETGIMTDPERMISLLHELTSTGITLSIDDFGTGYSSLAYLQRLPVSTVKIDRSFVAHLIDDQGAAKIVSSVIDLARSMGLVVVAEGVEDQATLDRLIALDCHMVQGYLLARPMPSGAFATWLQGAQAPQGWPPDGPPPEDRPSPDGSTPTDQPSDPAR